MLKILLTTIIAFIIVIIILLIFITFMNNNIKSTPRIKENFFSEPTFTNGIKNNVIGSTSAKYIQFNSNGTFVIGANMTCDIFMIGGGGGGGLNHGGGGGAGAYYLGSNITLNAGSYNINIGIGGTQGLNGGNTSITSNGNNIYLVNGGGGGGGSNYDAKSGGCGGGGLGWDGIGTRGRTTAGSANNSGTNGTGFAGGSGIVNMSGNALGGGGGGGIGGAGGNATDGGAGGNGGSGLNINITGTNVVYGGGGGGGAWYQQSDLGGTGGGVGGVIVGASAVNTTVFNTAGNNAVANTGSGGSGGASGIGYGGSGSAGVVIIRYDLGFMSDITSTGDAVAQATPTASQQYLIDNSKRVHRQVEILGSDINISDVNLTSNNVLENPNLGGYVRVVNSNIDISISSIINNSNNNPIKLFNKVVNTDNNLASFGSERYNPDGSFKSNNYGSNNINFPRRENLSRTNNFPLVLDCEAGEFISIRFPENQAFILSKYAFKIKDINNAPASWKIFGITRNIALRTITVRLIHSGTATREEYVENKMIEKFLPNNYDSYNHYVIVFERLIPTPSSVSQIPKALDIGQIYLFKNSVSESEYVSTASANISQPITT